MKNEGVRPGSAPIKHNFTIKSVGPIHTVARFVIRHSGLFRHSDFGIRHWRRSLFLVQRYYASTGCQSKTA
jgi:hypothetical protein